MMTLALVGCSRRDLPTGRVPSTDAVAESDAPQESVPTISVDSGFRDDPIADGWETEEFSRQALRQLEQLGTYLTTADHDDSQKSIGDGVGCPFLVPTELDTVYSDGTFVVQRWKNADASHRDVMHDTGPGAGALTRAMDQLASSFHGYRDVHFKFKLFRVDRDRNETTTRQYFHIHGSSTTARREQNAVWSAGWDANESRPPQLKWLRVEQFEQVTANNRSVPLLSDFTGTVLSGCKTFGECLVPGIDYWLSRLEAHCGVYRFGYHGLSLGDVNGDGADDLYVCQTGGLPNHLFVQQPDGSARDTAAEAKVDYLDNTRSALFVDLDNDGDQDLVLSLATGLLMLSNDGTGIFAERARIPSVRQGFSLSAADYDDDGYLDLYVCVYYGTGDSASELPLPLPYFDATNGGANYLIRNLGDWRFEDATARTGFDEGNHRFSFAGAWEDYDNDGDQDLLVVNDFGPNQLYRNDQDRFREVAPQTGLVDGGFGMSAAWGDFDRDGWMDAYVSNMFSAAGNRITFQPQFKSNLDRSTRARFQHLARGNSLFRNVEAQFNDVSLRYGVTMGRWSWASLFCDVNNDGWEDLLVTNGFITGQTEDDL